MVSTYQLLVLLLEIIASSHCVLKRGKYRLPVFNVTTTARGNPPPYDANDAGRRPHFVDENNRTFSRDDVNNGIRNTLPQYFDGRGDTPIPYEMLGVPCYHQPDENHMRQCKNSVKEAIIYKWGRGNYNMTKFIVTSHSNNRSKVTAFIHTPWGWEWKDFICEYLSFGIAFAQYR